MDIITGTAMPNCASLAQRSFPLPHQLVANEPLDGFHQTDGSGGLGCGMSRRPVHTRTECRSHSGDIGSPFLHCSHAPRNPGIPLRSPWWNCGNVS